jgi:ribosomal protein L39E
MARNKNLPTKIRRGKKNKQSQSVPSWIIRRSGGNVRSSPYSRREWRNRRLNKD